MSAKYLLIILLASKSLFTSEKFNSAANPQKFNDIQTNTIQSNKIKITIGSKTFSATLNDNSTAKAFKAMLPLTLKMDDLNSNEKNYNLPKILPGQLIKPETIQTGDLMIWSGNILVLFYKPFSTPYSYAILGYINDPSGLAAALGAGSVTVTYELAI